MIITSWLVREPESKTVPYSVSLEKRNGMIYLADEYMSDSHMFITKLKNLISCSIENPKAIVLDILFGLNDNGLLTDVSVAMFSKSSMSVKNTYKRLEEYYADFLNKSLDEQVTFISGVLS